MGWDRNCLSLIAIKRKKLFCCLEWSWTQLDVDGWLLGALFRVRGALHHIHRSWGVKHILGHSPSQVAKMFPMVACLSRKGRQRLPSCQGVPRAPIHAAISTWGQRLRELGAGPASACFIAVNNTMLFHMENRKNVALRVCLYSRTWPHLKGNELSILARTTLIPKSSCRL